MRMLRWEEGKQSVRIVTPTAENPLRYLSRQSVCLLLFFCFSQTQSQKQRKRSRAGAGEWSGEGGRLARGSCSSCLVLLLPGFANDTDVLKQKTGHTSFDWMLLFRFLFRFALKRNKFTNSQRKKKKKSNSLSVCLTSHSRLGLWSIRCSRARIPPRICWGPRILRLERTTNRHLSSFPASTVAAAHLDHWTRAAQSTHSQACSRRSGASSSPTSWGHKQTGGYSPHTAPAARHGGPDTTCSNLESCLHAGGRLTIWPQQG